MLRAALIVAAVELVATGAGAATLTITPDKAVYSVGENIVLSVVGDSEGGTESFVYGRLVFNGERASYVSASQTPLTSFNGTVQWVPLPLVGGPGFGEAFFQIGSVNDFPVDNLLEATAVLLATTPGTLDLAWGSAGDELRFFGLTTAPGVSVTIVPEPSTLLLVSTGAFVMAWRRASFRRRTVAPARHRVAE